MSLCRYVVIAPTFDNAATLRGLVEAVAAYRLPIIVVNDGSTDATASILDTFGNAIDVVTHPHNRGKAAALRSGFERAIHLEFTHALTIDTDGQHDPADIPELIDLSFTQPEAIVLGARDARIAGYPAGNRLGRRVSNFFVWLHSGARVTDSQCGLRIYPLTTHALPARAGRYGFETEILVRAGWAHVPVVEQPIRCVYEIATGRVSHFQPWRDTARAIAMHARLLTRALMPWRPMRIGTPDDASTTGTIVERLARWFSPMRAWRAIRHDMKERRRFAAALSLGVLIANLPLYGVQSLLSLVLARRLRLHPLAVLAGSHLSTPPIGPLLIVAAIATGHFILHGSSASLADLDPSRIGYVELLRRVALEWIIGSIVCGVALALLTFVLVRLTMRVTLPRDNPV